MTISGPVVPKYYSSVLQFGTPNSGDGAFGEIITCTKSGRVFLVPNTSVPQMVGPVAVDGTNATTDKVYFEQGTGIELRLERSGTSGTFVVNVPTDFTAGITENGSPISGGGGFTPVRQAYTSTTSGIAIPSGATRLRCICWGGGGGGGGGALNNALTSRCGGGGGGGCSVNINEYLVSDLSGTLTVTVGAGGLGGAGATSVAATPGPGTAGGISAVQATWKGTFMRISWGYNGAGGNRSATGTVASGGPAGSQGYVGGIGGNGQANTTGSIGAQTSQTGLSISCHGGGGGGGVNTSNSNFPGGQSFGSYVPQDPNVLGGATAGANGANENAGRGTDWDYSRAGGGGGAGNASGSGGDGGNGGYGAGGGGGGGGTWLGVVEKGGDGGNGGNGLVVLYWT